MKEKELIKSLGFLPKENTSDIFYKKYQDYSIEIDLKNQKFNYGNKINLESSTTLNFSQPENWVVLECVDRLLEKGYQPQNITLEKTWKTGHGTSGRLDILVTRDNGSAYLMIECKTWGAEFEKEFKKMEKDGGQLFTYFQQDKDADILMLYASSLDGKSIKYRNEIIKIEEDYRQTGNVKDFFERWNKLPKSNGVFDSWVTPYEFQSKALTKNDLIEIKQEDSSFIFNRFLEILRHNVVSDKPNAFNKIFTLFLCKIVDENRNPDEQLHFQWREGEDDHISFQKRLTDLYRRGMKELLEKKVSDVSDSEFDNRFQQVEEKYRDEIKDILTEIRLKKNNEFAIKEVYDDASFQENAKVVKEVVQLLQGFKIRYNYRQQFLSDFFEMLLTTGLKQESGQFFTPVPLARFIIKSLPIREITAQKIVQGNKNDLLPNIIDYAAGSGHFITESMEEIQKYIDILSLDDYKPETRKQIDGFQRVQFDWAEKYIYGIEKDYRLVKTAKVSCYLHGDGLAKVIHGDGLADFATANEYKDLLTETDRTYPQDNKQFDIIISNPPYSVSSFKSQMDEEKSKVGFDLYNRLTDQSSEIECLFIERTKQLLKDGGVAGIILPSSILSNTGIYSQTREILLKYFEIVGIAELGSNTFMATGTNTVTLFLRRRNNADAYNIEEATKKSFVNLQDVTINGIENPITKYLAQVWDTISFDDYKTLMQSKPNEKVLQHEIYQEYKKNIKVKKEKELSNKIIAIEQDKLLYFILTYSQKLVLVKTGQKSEEKRFLGYEFSNRRGNEGIHPIQRSKSIDECTHLYDADDFVNPEKASTYIYKAFNNEYDLTIPEKLKNNISYKNLVDMLTFDRSEFEKSISLSAKKKVKIESKWQATRIKDLCEIGRGRVINKKEIESNSGEYPVYSSQTSNEGIFGYLNTFDFEGEYATWTTDGIYAGSVFYRNGKFNCTNVCGTLKAKSDSLNMRYLAIVLPNYTDEYVVKVANPKLMNNVMAEIKIPLPPLDIQEKIVAEIEGLEKKEQKAIEEILSLKEKIIYIFNKEQSNMTSLKNIIKLQNGKGLSKVDQKKGEYLVYGGNGIIGTHNDFVSDKETIAIGRVGANCGVVHKAEPRSWITDNSMFVKEFLVDINLDFLFHSLKKLNLNDFSAQSSHPNISQPVVLNQRIPLPTIEIQKKIVTEIEKIESKISELEKQIADIPAQKEAVLKKYL
jgi:type I restriction enzyme M protein